MCLDELKDIPCSEYRPTVLLVQADKEDLDKIAVASEFAGKYDFMTANSGTDVINKVNANCFDAVILGLKFEDITGSTLAYLIHEFDPLISIAFLSNYKSSILISVATDLHCKFWDKDEEMLDLPSLCDKIYDLAIEMPCSNDERVVRRDYMKERRELYDKYTQLTVPHSLAKVIHSRREI